MALSLNLKGEDVDASCHYLPCKINYSGKCNVSKYFTPKIHDANTFTASLRGYPLEGQTIQVPKGYKGIILQEDKKVLTDEEDRELKVKGTFSEFTSWNWDVKPSDDDKLVKALQWIKIARALHKPVDVSDDISITRKGSPKKQCKRKHRDLDH